MGDELRRKRKSLILKSRSASSLSVNNSVSKDKKLKHGKGSSGTKLYPKIGISTPNGNQSKLDFFQSHMNQKPKANAHSGVPSHQGHGSSSFHFLGGFLTRPKDKSGLTKLEKDLTAAIDSLKHIRKEVSALKQSGSKIEIQEAKRGDPSSSNVIITGLKVTGGGSRALSPSNARLNLQTKMSNSDLKKKQLTANKSCSNFFAKTESTPSFEDKINSHGIVKNLLGQLASQQIASKPQISTMDEFLQRLSPKAGPSGTTGANSKIHNASATEHSLEGSSKQIQANFMKLIETLMLAMGNLNDKFSKADRPSTTSKACQTDEKEHKTIAFSNINLSKTVEELIKKIIIESKTVKYDPNTLIQYFESLVLSDRENHRQISDMQKQALFVSIYSLLQRQMLVEVTLEMIKDSGVNVQNLFQYTFSRIGLDYDKYVQYENHRDQDLSARTIFEGDLDCSLVDEEQSDRGMVLNGYSNLGKFNYFPLDFCKLQQTQTQDAPVDGDEEHHQNSRSTKK